MEAYQLISSLRNIEQINAGMFPVIYLDIPNCPRISISKQAAIALLASCKAEYYDDAMASSHKACLTLRILQETKFARVD